MNYAHIKDNKVVNVIVWDGESELSYSNELVLLTNNAGIDWDYIDGEFIDNRPEINIEGI
jgi:hypothetical protein